MDYSKLNPEICNTKEDNLSKLAALFPSAVKDGELDITALKEELGQFEEVGAEKYELTWAGKQAAKKLSVAPKLLWCCKNDIYRPTL